MFGWGAYTSLSLTAQDNTSSSLSSFSSSSSSILMGPPFQVSMWCLDGLHLPVSVYLLMTAHLLPRTAHHFKCNTSPLQHQFSSKLLFGILTLAVLNLGTLFIVSYSLISKKKGKFLQKLNMFLWVTSLKNYVTRVKRHTRINPVIAHFCPFFGF